MNKRFEALDSFRGLSAIFVVIFHMHFLNSLTEINFFQNSAYFVDFFFLLSGFVLTHTYAFRNITFKSFFITRTFRLLPLHIIILMVFVCFEFIKFIAINYGIKFESLPFQGQKQVSDLIYNILLIHGWFPTTNLTWNVPSWSVSVEYYIYIIFFLTLYNKKYFRIFTWISISFISFYFVSNEVIFNTALRGLSSFFTGSLIYLIYKYLDNLQLNFNKLLFSLFELIGISIIVLFFSIDIDSNFLLMNFIFALNMLLFSFEKGYLSFLLKNKILLYLGKLSYSIYLTHAAILLIVTTSSKIIEKVLDIEILHLIDNHKYIDFGEVYLNNLAIIIILLIIIVVSGLTHKFIEIPGQNFGKKLNLKLQKKDS